MEDLTRKGKKEEMHSVPRLDLPDASTKEKAQFLHTSSSSSAKLCAGDVLFKIVTSNINHTNNIGDVGFLLKLSDTFVSEIPTVLKNWNLYVQTSLFVKDRYISCFPKAKNVSTSSNDINENSNSCDSDNDNAEVEEIHMPDLSEVFLDAYMFLKTNGNISKKISNEVALAIDIENPIPGFQKPESRSFYMVEWCPHTIKGDKCHFFSELPTNEICTLSGIGKVRLANMGYCWTPFAVQTIFDKDCTTYYHKRAIPIKYNHLQSSPSNRETATTSNESPPVKRSEKVESIIGEAILMHSVVGDMFGEGGGGGEEDEEEEEEEGETSKGKGKEKETPLPLTSFYKSTIAENRPASYRRGNRSLSDRERQNYTLHFANVLLGTLSALLVSDFLGKMDEYVANMRAPSHKVHNRKMGDKLKKTGSTLINLLSSPRDNNNDVDDNNDDVNDRCCCCYPISTFIDWFYVETTDDDIGGAFEMVGVTRPSNQVKQNNNNNGEDDYSITDEEEYSVVALQTQSLIANNSSDFVAFLLSCIGICGALSRSIYISKTEKKYTAGTSTHHHWTSSSISPSILNSNAVTSLSVNDNNNNNNNDDAEMIYNVHLLDYYGPQLFMHHNLDTFKIISHDNGETKDTPWLLSNVKMAFMIFETKMDKLKKKRGKMQSYVDAKDVMTDILLFTKDLSDILGFTLGDLHDLCVN